ncbi:MAG: hypothetical protein KDK39_01350 [Leptospiraceae bacterium]|nr:hypothetical protein [Leptospiraceae bacterium]
MRIDPEIWRATIGRLRQVKAHLAGLASSLSPQEIDAMWSKARAEVVESNRLKLYILRAQRNGEPYFCRQCKRPARLYQNNMCQTCLAIEFKERSIPTINHTRRRAAKSRKTEVSRNDYARKTA